MLVELDLLPNAIDLKENCIKILTSVYDEDDGRLERFYVAISQLYIKNYSLGPAITYYEKYIKCYKRYYDTLIKEEKNKLDKKKDEKVEESQKENREKENEKQTQDIEKLEKQTQKNLTDLNYILDAMKSASEEIKKKTSQLKSKDGVKKFYDEIIQKFYFHMINFSQSNKLSNNFDEKVRSLIGPNDYVLLDNYIKQMTEQFAEKKEKIEETKTTNTTTNTTNTQK